MNKTVLSLSTLVASLIVSSFSVAKTVNVSSPDNQIIVSVNDDEQPTYQVSFNNEVVITPSKLGMLFKNAHGFSDGFKITSVTKKQVNNNWSLPWG